MCCICVYHVTVRSVCLILYLIFSLTGSGSEDKTPQASQTHHAASSCANPSLEVMDNDEEPIGDRWDDEEDWGSLEV